MRRAKKDTIAFEPVGVIPGDDTVVRREVKAGWDIPDHYQLENDGDAEDVGSGMTTGLGAAPQAYKHQLDDDGLLAEEHSKGTEEVDEDDNAVSRRPAARGHARGRKSKEGRVATKPGQEEEHPAGAKMSGEKPE